VDILPLIPEIKPLVPSGHLESGTQRPPFTAGQILTATVTSQEAPTLFTLQTGGQQLAVESSGHLRVGQQLTIEVTALSPQLRLQIRADTPVNQRINTSLHLLAHQGQVFSQIASLAQSARHSAQLSTAAQQTLQQMQTSLEAFSPGSPQITSMIAGIAGRLQSLTPGASPAQTVDTMHAVGRLLQQIAGSAAVSSPIQEEAADLARALLTLRGPADAATAQAMLPVPSGEPAAAPLGNLADLVRQLGAINPSLAALLLPMLTPSGRQPLPAGDQLMEQLLSLLTRTGLESAAGEKAPVDGRSLQQTLHTVGMNLERLLAEGKGPEAANTLKFALLEMANTATQPAQMQQAEEMLQSIQLAQLLNLRLSADSIFFMPLPFPFLHSGFLLIDTEKERNKESRDQTKGGGNAQVVHMHLQLEGLGNLQIDIHQDGEAIGLTFYAEDGERARFIGEHREELRQQLSAGQLHSVQFLIGAKEPVKQLLAQLVHGSTGMINTTA
jgi:hypothetical protein